MSHTTNHNSQALAQVLQQLEQILQQRKLADADSSYVASLASQRV